MFTVDLSSLSMKETDLTIPTTLSEKVDIMEEEEVVSQDQVEPVTTLHLNKSAKRVRESLSKLRSLTYIVDSVELLDQAKADLDGIMKKLLAGCPSEVGLTLEPTPQNTPTKQTKVPRKRKNMTYLNKLPSRKKRKQTTCKPARNTIAPLSSPKIKHKVFNKSPRRVPAAKATNSTAVLHETNPQHIETESCDVNSTLSGPESLIRKARNLHTEIAHFVKHHKPRPLPRGNDKHLIPTLIPTKEDDAGTEEQKSELASYLVKNFKKLQDFTTRDVASLLHATVEFVHNYKKEEKDNSSTSKRNVRWEDGFESELKITDVDKQKAINKVDKIWKEGMTHTYFLSRVYRIDVTYEDIYSLKEKIWLTDKVMDAYLSYLAQTEMDKGQLKVKHQLVTTTNNIINGAYVPGRQEKNTLNQYDVIIGAYHQRGGHWDLLIIEPPKSRIVFLNPMGESHIQRRTVPLNWKKYVGQLMLLHPERPQRAWTMEIPEHSKQQDGSSCGIYCLMFAERYLSGASLQGITLAEANRKRRDVAHTLMMFEGYMEGCPGCGFETNGDEEPLIQCITCQKWFHKKNHCVGEDVAEQANLKQFVCEVDR